MSVQHAWDNTGAISSGNACDGVMNSAITRFRISDGGRKSFTTTGKTFDTIWLQHLILLRTLHEIKKAKQIRCWLTNGLMNASILISDRN